MEETQALHARIVASSPPPPMTSIPTKEPVGGQHALEQLQVAMQKFDEARDQLQQAIQLAEQSIACQDRTDSHTK